MEEKVQILLTKQELDLIANCLVQRPYIEVANVINSIQAQLLKKDSEEEKGA